MSVRKIAYVLFMISYVSAMAASIAGLRTLGMWLGGPALIVSGWAFFGHLVTLDDELPGEWSNPEGSRRTWYLSLGELGIKSVILIALVGVVYI